MLLLYAVCLFIYLCISSRNSSFLWIVTHPFDEVFRIAVYDFLVYLVVPLKLLRFDCDMCISIILYLLSACNKLLHMRFVVVGAERDSSRQYRFSRGGAFVPSILRLYQWFLAQGARCCSCHYLL